METLEVRTLLSTLAADGTTDFDTIVGASAARSQYHVDGTGSAVAVIDAGVDYNDAALGGGFGPGHKVVAGFDFSNNTADPIATSLQHGTSVAGLIASNDPSHLGIAPGTNIVALRVFDNNNNGSFDQIASALQWVIDNHAQYNITTVNMSVSDGRNYSQNWYANDGGIGQKITGLIGKLDAMNIPVVTATGNSFTGTQGMGFPSIVSDAISVTATDASDQLVSDAQRLASTGAGSSATTVAAPASNVDALIDNNNFVSSTGTSYAAPMVTGAIVLMQEVYQQRFGALPTVTQLETWLQQGADPIHDSVTGITIGRLDIPKSIGLIPNPATQTLTPPTPPPTTTTPPASGGTTTTPITVTVTPTPPTTTTTPPASGGTTTTPITVTVTPTPPTTTAPTPPTTTTTPPASGGTTTTPTPPATTTTPPTTVVTTPPASGGTTTTPITVTPTPPVTTVTTPPAQTTPSTPASTAPFWNDSTGSSVSVWVAGQSVSGQSVSNVQLSGATGGATGLPNWFLTVLQSIQNWWTAPRVITTSSVKVAGVSQPGTPQPAGTLTRQSHPVPRAVHAKHPADAVSHQRQTFVASRRGR